MLSKRNLMSTDESKNVEENPEFKSSNMYGYRDNKEYNPVSKPIKRCKYFENINLLDEDGQEKQAKSSKASSVLDQYCKTNVLDESDDFINCEAVNKFKNGKNESATKNSKREFVSCEICKEDITHLDVFSRSVHVNNCIDQQIVLPAEPEIQTSGTQNVFILECPLCFKHFPSPESRASHIKKCGKSKGLSLQSIIKALELQERHALERISLGLPAKPVKPPKSNKNTVSKRAIAEPKNKAQSDIQLAKALSLSLANVNKQNEEDNNVNITFVTLKPPNIHQQPGKKNKKAVCTPVLVLRTEEERKKLFLDKVASIVAPQISCKEDSHEDTESSSSARKNENLLEPPLLWKLSGRALEKHEYYVESLLDWIQPSDIEVGAKLCHLSQIAGHEIVTQLPCDYTFGSEEAEEQNCLEYSEASPPSLIASLRSLVASSWMSDVDIYTACGTVIPAHRLLLAVRCPLLKQDSDFCSKNGRVSLKWENTSFDAALQFLNFIYTGSIEIEGNMKSDLLYLANKYEVFDLQTLLLSNQKIGTQSEIEINEKVSEEFGYVDSSPPPSQKQILKPESSPLCETQDSTNIDLEIVFNCINSSLKPSQAYMGEPSTSSPPASLQLESKTNSGHSSDLYCNGFISSADTSQCITSNCTLPERKTTTSPVIFDDSEREDEMDVSSDDESVELPVNCSQKSVLQECNLDENELDLCNTESNSSQDSVKFLESSFPVHNSLLQTPLKEKNDSVSTSSKVSINHFGEESPLSASNMTRNSEKSILKSCKQKIDTLKSYEFPSDEYANLELPISPHLKISFSSFKGEDQANNEINLKEISFTETLDKTDVINVVCESDEARRVSLHHLNSMNTTLHSIIPEECTKNFGCDIIPVREFSGNESNVLLTPEKSMCAGKAPPLRRASSPEVLICDSDSDLKSPTSLLQEKCVFYHEENNVPPSEIKPNFCNIRSVEKSPKTSLNFQERGNFLEESFENKAGFGFLPSTSDIQLNFISNVSSERKSAASSETLCPAFDAKSSPDSIRHSFLGDQNCELKGRFSITVPPSEEVGSNKQVGSPKSSQTPFKLPDEPQYECFEHFECDILPSPEPETSEMHTPQHSTFIKDNHVNKSVAATSYTQPQFQMTDSPITPLPDYKNMVTPEIKQALRKIGVKALPRKKAVALLSHVYNETHPLIDGEIKKASSPEKPSKKEKLKKRKRHNEIGSKQTKRLQTEVHCAEAISGTQDSDDSSSENPEWQGCVPEISFSQFTQDSPTKATKDDMETIKQYIQSNEELYNNILTYTPLNLVAFHQELKDNGIKISIQKLMDFLDEQCITFTCPRKEEYQKKQTARAQRFRKNMIARFSQQTS